jgi:hypothetical protein
MYRLLQFFTLLQAYASGFSILRHIYDFVGESEIFFVLILIIISTTIGGWIWWYYHAERCVFCKVCAGAIAGGIVLGLLI